MGRGKRRTLINGDKAASVGRNTPSQRRNGGVRGGWREEKGTREDRHMEDAVNERGLLSGEA